MEPIDASVEVNDEGAIAFACAYPGACGWGPSEAAAIERLRSDVQRTYDWLVAYGLDGRLGVGSPAGTSIEVVERVPATGDVLACDSEACFGVDRRAYRSRDLADTRALLSASRADFLDVVGPVSSSALDRRLVAGRRTGREILEHLTDAEHWYRTQVAAPPGYAVGSSAEGDEVVERLAEVRVDTTRFLDALADVPPADRAAEWVHDGERWTYAKVLRRLVWHERLHTTQLRGLVPKLTG